MVVSVTVTQDGITKFLRRTASASNLRRTQRSMLSRAGKHMKKVLRSESRVKSSAYKASWRTAHHGDSISLFNAVIGKQGQTYGEYVTGNTMPDSGSSKRGAGAKFMRKVMREQKPAIRKIMEDRIREMVRGGRFF